jgi:hypothetical protein
MKIPAVPQRLGIGCKDFVVFRVHRLIHFDR